MKNEIRSSYRAMYKITTLSTPQIITALSLKHDLAEATIEKYLFDDPHGLPERSNSAGHPNSADIIPIGQIVSKVEEHMRTGCTKTRACQMVAMEYGVNRATILRRYNDA